MHAFTHLAQTKINNKQWSVYLQAAASTVQQMTQLAWPLQAKWNPSLRGINMAIRNNQDGVGLIQTAESGLNEIRNMVLRIRELAVQMANGIYENTPDRANAQLEVTALLEQVDLIAENTRFNDIALLDGTFSGVAIQAGNTTAETISLTFVDLGQSGLSINGASIATQSSATTVIGTMDTALYRQSLKNRQNLVPTKTA